MNATDKLTEAEKFHNLVRAGEWGDAADMVRVYARDQGYREINTDALADWLAAGTWSGTETPESVAREWDEAND